MATRANSNALTTDQNSSTTISRETTAESTSKASTRTLHTTVATDSTSTTISVTSMSTTTDTSSTSIASTTSVASTTSTLSTGSTTSTASATSTASGVTVTVTASSTAYPLDASQIASYTASNKTGTIVALVALAFFLLVGLSILLGSAILWCRRPRKQPVMTENPDTSRKGGGAFLPVIGSINSSRKSWLGGRQGDSQTQGSRGADASTQSLMSHGSSHSQARRLSMWADELLSQKDSTPSPPLRVAYSRSSSAASTVRLGHNPVPSDDASSIYSGKNQYTHASELELGMLRSQSLVPARLETADASRPPREVRYYDPRVSPLASPVHGTGPDTSHGLHDQNMARAYDNGMYA